MSADVPMSQSSGHAAVSAADTPLTSGFDGSARYDGATTTAGPGSVGALFIPGLTPPERGWT